jgi:hypothetical protein
MGKGLPRSLERAGISTQHVPNSVVKTRRFPVNHTFNVSAVGAGNGGGSVVIGDIPEGNILIIGRAANLSFTTASANISNATYTATFAVGSTADADANVASPATDSDIMAARAATIAAAKVSPATNYFLAGTDNLSVALNNRDAAMELNLNVTVVAADIVDGSSAPFTATGFVEIAYCSLGDG